MAAELVVEVKFTLDELKITPAELDENLSKIKTRIVDCLISDKMKLDMWRYGNYKNIEIKNISISESTDHLAMDITSENFYD